MAALASEIKAVLYLPLKASLNQINSLSGALLVLNTVIKMQKNKFCLNFYTAGRNTKKVEMPGGKGRVNISNNYVAPSDGWVRLQVNGTGNGSYIQLLSSDGYANTVIGFSSGNVVNGMLPLRKGATFTYVLGECTLSAAQFYPC